MSAAVDHADDLLSRGYTEVTELGDFKVGARVRNVNEQYLEALASGTGTVERIFHRPDSAWARRWGGPDAELIVKRDESRFGATHAFLGHHHAVAIEAALIETEPAQ